MAFTFDPSTGQYRDGAGRIVPDTTVRAALERIIDVQSAAARDLTQQLADGTIALAVWQARMMGLIKSVHLVGLALADGGWSQLDQSDFGWVGSQIKPQYQYLRAFAADIASGKQPMNGTLVVRATMYVGAARLTHRAAQRRLAVQMLAGEERRILGKADHCPTCLQQAKLGWQPFGTLKRLGDSECRTNCRCWFTFRDAPAMAA